VLDATRAELFFERNPGDWVRVPARHALAAQDAAAARESVYDYPDRPGYQALGAWAGRSSGRRSAVRSASGRPASGPRVGGAADHGHREAVGPEAAKKNVNVASCAATSTITAGTR
jgi:hypothetical protein